MNRSIFALFAVFIAVLSINSGCGGQSEGQTLSPEQRAAITYLDSIHGLNPKQWMYAATQLPDSVYNSQQELSIRLKPEEAKAIFDGAKKGSIPLKYLFLFAPGTNRSDLAFFDEVNDEIVEVRLHDFGNNRCFAIEVVNQGWECDVYFFDHNFVVARHHIFHKYGLEIESLSKDVDFPVIYYKQNFESGTGVWWWNYHFFRYGKDGLKPALNTLQNANIANPGGPRILWYEATIVKANPLKMKVVYSTQIPGPHEMDYQKIIDDSTYMIWVRENGRLEPDFSKSKLTAEKMASYSLNSPEELFIYAHYDLLKGIVTGKDKQRSKLVMRYLKQTARKSVA